MSLSSWAAAVFESTDVTRTSASVTQSDHSFDSPGMMVTDGLEGSRVERASLGDVDQAAESGRAISKKRSSVVSIMKVMNEVGNHQGFASHLQNQLDGTVAQIAHLGPARHSPTTLSCALMCPEAVFPCSTASFAAPSRMSDSATIA